MKRAKFKAAIYLISFTVLLTVGIQVYRNIQNYALNKERFINDVQLALDNGVEAYYAAIAKTDVFYFEGELDSLKPQMSAAFAGKFPGLTIRKTGSNDSSAVLRILADSSAPKDSVRVTSISVMSDTAHQLQRDSLFGFSTTKHVGFGVSPDSLGVKTVARYKELAQKMIISMIRDTVDFTKLSPLVQAELENQNIAIDYKLIHFSKGKQNGSYNSHLGEDYSLKAVSQSNLLPSNQRLEMDFENASLIILKRGMVDLIISLLISIAVIGSLLFLYKIINQQKQLAEIKNDLISNITHEFKTPIATVISALEGIANFNQQNDPEKTAKYLDISAGQLKKLNLMVEKLLETATLDSESLDLRKEPVNLSQMLGAMIEKYKMVVKQKNIRFLEHAKDAIIEADPFHLENAISNLIDNAIKYGGSEIMVSLAQENGHVQVIVQDNGGMIDKSQKERVFDKFYRIPTGNQHDVKGFGIGLYYTKKIIEKHGGSIGLVLKPQLTSFEVAI